MLGANEMMLLLPGRPAKTLPNPMSDAPRWLEIKALVRRHLGDCTIEHITVLHEKQRRDMFCDEDFQAKELPFNELATSIYRAWTMSQRPGQDPNKLPAVCGPALLFGRIVWR